MVVKKTSVIDPRDIGNMNTSLIIIIIVYELLNGAG